MANPKTSNIFTKINTLLNQNELILILLLVTLVLRLPSIFEPFWYGDENIYLAIGNAMNKGALLYRDVTDYPNKPPAIYLLAALVQNVFRFRLLLIFWTLASVFFFYQISYRFLSKKITTISTLIFIFFSSTPIIEGNISNAEIFFILPTMIGFWFLTKKPHLKKFPKSQKTQNHFFAGLFLGLSFLFKIHVLFDIAALFFIFYLLDKSLNLKLPRSVLQDKLMWAFSFGTSLPPLITLTVWTFLGVSPLDLVSNATGSTKYVSVWSQKELIVQTIGMGSLQARLALLLILTLLITRIKKHLLPKTIIFTIWGLFALFAVLLSARPYPHYLIQLLPPLILGIPIVLNSQKASQIIVYSTVPLLVFLAYFRFEFSHWQILPYYKNFANYISGKISRTDYYRNFDSRMPRNYAVAKYLRTITSPNDQIYIWGTDPGIYVLADRLQAGTLVTSFHVEDLNYDQALIDLLETNSPKAIVIMENEWRQFEKLYNLIVSDYTLTNIIGDPGLPSYQTQNQKARIFLNTSQ